MASADVWKECLNWLRRCGIALPENIKPTQSVEFFSRYLRDGVLLCHLIHLLNPKALEYFFDVSELICMDPDKNQELCLQNIEVFLLICQTDFGLKPSDLFEAKMLYHLTDFDRVLHTLSQLSKSPIVKELGITEFPVPRRRSDGDGAVSTKKEITPDNSRPPGVQQMFRSISSIYEPANEVMYMCLLPDLGTNPRVHDNETLLNDPVERAVQKMLKAEKEYINILTVMEEKMFGHLSKMLTSKEQTIIFYGIKELNQIHQQIQRELISSMGNQENKSLTKLYIVFLNWKDKLHIYHRYAANLPAALHVVGAVYRAKKEVAKEVELAQASLRDRFKLTNLLLKPIQHVSQYSVILEEIRKYISENHEDYNGLKYASQSMLELEQHVNAIKKDSFLIQSLEHVQSTICGWKPSKPQVREFGRFFKDGVLRTSCPMTNDSNQKIKYQVFLFSRTIIFCTPKSGQIINLRKISRNEPFTYQFHLILQNCSVDELVGLAGFFEDPTIPWTSSWRVKGPKGKTSVTFYSKTPEERLKWIESFKDVMAQLHPSLDSADASTHTFELQTFSSVVDCHVCHKLLKGLLDQGYRCTKCKEPFHKQCLESAKRCSAVDEEIYSEILPDFEQDSGIHEVQSSFDSSSQSGESASRIEETAVQNFERLAVVQQVETSIQPNESLETQPWFGGSMSGLEATAHLIGTPPGTFLVRRRDSANLDAYSAPFAISVMMECGVKHIKVQCFRSQPDECNYLTLGSSWSKQEYFLVPGYTFPTINDLVYCYSHNFLSEEVSLAMDVYLKIPFKMTQKKLNYTTL